MKFYATFLIITIVSFLGFLVENIWLIMTKGYFDNRNMVFPLLLGYGLAVGLIYLMFGTPGKLRIFFKKIEISNKLICAFAYFLLVFSCVFVGEIVLGTLVEKTCGLVWWDYSMLPMHVTKYTSVPTTICFSLMITIFMQYFFTPLQNLFESCNPVLIKYIALFFIVIMVADFVHSAWYLFKKRSFMRIWKRVVYLK